jgi:hypothetical protein
MLLGAINFVEKPIHNMPEVIDLIKQAVTTDTRSRQARLEIAEIGRRLAKLSDPANIIRKLQADSIPQLVRLVLRYRVGTRRDVALASSSKFRPLEAE